MPPKHHRITRGDDYRRIVREGRRVKRTSFIAHTMMHGEQHRPARFGFIISRAVGNAVTRNLVRRRLNTAVERNLAAGFCGADIVLRVLPAAASCSFGQLEQDVNQVCARVCPIPPRLSC